MTTFGYSPEQAYLLLGAAPIEGRMSGVVDIPNSCATVYLPTAIFDFDVRPSASGPARVPQGTSTPHASPLIVNAIADSQKAAGKTGPALYTTSLYIMIALQAIGFLANELIRPVNAKFHEPQATGVGGQDTVATTQRGS
ncbi:acetamidase/formamidase family protein [Nonomuraea sp. CA-141351]|uniref:acetamidase/formamidase family protein n=1 Tax=Nonomuraea sp. CA-141351 TaxID=3239996 RepID=UPI003D8C91B1